MKHLLCAAAVVALALGCSGCIPLVIGGYVGYQMAQQHDHDQWCQQHIGDPSCHP